MNQPTASGFYRQVAFLHEWSDIHAGLNLL